MAKSRFKKRTIKVEGITCPVLISEVELRKLIQVYNIDLDKLATSSYNEKNQLCIEVDEEARDIAASIIGIDIYNKVLEKAPPSISSKEIIELTTEIITKTMATFNELTDEEQKAVDEVTAKIQERAETV